MPDRSVTPHTPATSLYGDEFTRGVGYTNWRPKGGGDWLLIYTASGSGAIGVGETLRSTRPGDLLLYEPRAAQDYSTAEGPSAAWNLLWVHFLPRASWHLWLQWPAIAPGTRLISLPVAQRRACEEALRRMVRAIRRPGPIQTELGMAALEEVVLLGRAAQVEEQSPPGDERIGQAVRVLTDRFKAPFHLPALARQCGLSVSRFSHLFRLQVGRSPGRFLEAIRFSHAAQMLRLTSLPIAEIAAESGFESPFYFTHRFRRHHGVSPTTFRAAARRP